MVPATFRDSHAARTLASIHCNWPKARPHPCAMRVVAKQADTGRSVLVTADSHLPNPRGLRPLLGSGDGSRFTLRISVLAPDLQMV